VARKRRSTKIPELHLIITLYQVSRRK
jgi:hypothetical protein